MFFGNRRRTRKMTKTKLKFIMNRINIIVKMARTKLAKAFATYYLPDGEWIGDATCIWS